MKKMHLFQVALGGVILLVMLAAEAGVPLWTFQPLTPTNFTIPSNVNATVKYIVTNQSSKPHTLTVTTALGMTQITTGNGICGNPFILSAKGASCILSLQISGSQLSRSIIDGPIVCQQGSTSLCYQPSQANVLSITQGSAITIPGNCVDTGGGNTACQLTIAGQTNYGFTNMKYALCRSATCSYTNGDTTVQCTCDLKADNDGINSASVSPKDFDASKPGVGTVTSTYSMVNSSGETPTNCSKGPFANCYGATCTVSGGIPTCTCPVDIDTYIAPQTNCIAGSGKIWSATSTSSFFSIEATMLFMYDTFFGGQIPS